MKIGTVLFVDDEKNVLSSLKRGLIEEKYRCIFALSGSEALELMDKEEVAVIVTDMKMPGMNGLRLLQIAKQKHPHTIRIVLSGYTQLPQILATINQADIFKFIMKPWNLEDELKPVINQAIEYYTIQKEGRAIKEAVERRNELYLNMLKSMEDKLISCKNSHRSVLRVIKYILGSVVDKMNRDMILDNVQINSIINEIHLVQEILSGYFEVMPTTAKYFKIKALMEDLIKTPEVNNNSCSIKAKVIEDTGREYYLNYYLIIFVLRSIVKFILENKMSKNLKIEAAATQHGITFLVRFGEGLSVVNREYVLEETVLPLLEEIIRDVSGGIIYSKADNNINININTDPQ